MSKPRQFYVAVIGAGGVGRVFLSQLEGLADRYASHPTAPVHLSLVYVSRSKKCLFSKDYSPIAFQGWQADLEKATTPPLSPTELADFLSKASGPSVVVDNTSSQDVAESYPLFLQRGISVITPNKKAFSSDLSLWEAIFGAAANGSGDAEKGGYVFNESSVGAGLPVISTLKDLNNTGDTVTKIEGVFSGSLSFVFNSFMPASGGGGRFSDAVIKAKELGFTEPDPRDDLNGLDVARKLTILARLSGLKIQSPTSFPVQSLIPKELENCSSGDEFVSRLPEFDDKIESVKKEAESEGKVLRYVGTIDVSSGQLEVAMQKFDKAHPIAGLTGSANIFNFYTKRYGSDPLIIQGQGAGGEITAMGVTSDLIKVINVMKRD